jgi:hypothetical protein
MVNGQNFANIDLIIFIFIFIVCILLRKYD